MEQVGQLWGVEAVSRYLSSPADRGQPAQFRVAPTGDGFIMKLFRCRTCGAVEFVDADL